MNYNVISISMLLLATVAIVSGSWFLGTMTESITPTTTIPVGSNSGLQLLIDEGTGCHYLGYNGLTPRLDAIGRHICTKPSTQEGEK